MTEDQLQPTNLMSEDEAIDHAYDIFLELAADNLDPADIIIFNLEFEKCGAAESYTPAEDWADYVDDEIDPEYYTEVVIGLTDANDVITETFARILISLDEGNKFCHIIWRK